MKIEDLKHIVFFSTSYYGTIFLFLLILILSFTIFIPSLKRVQEIREAVDNERFELEKLYTRGQVVHEVKIKLEQTKEDLPLIESTMLKAGGELEFIKNMEKLALYHSLKQRLDLSQAQEERGFKVIPFNLEIIGDFRDALSYIRELEKLEGYVSLDSLDISRLDNRDSNTPEPGKVKALLKIQTFWQN